MGYNIIDLFCGCGGFSKGFSDAGCKILFATDGDATALKSYSFNFSNVKLLCGDITKINYQHYVRKLIGDINVDIIIGGPPCKGMKVDSDNNICRPENYLFLSYTKFVEEIKPKAFVIENIPDIAFEQQGRVKNSIIGYFANLGYLVKNFVLCAADYGVPQYRTRSIFIGIRGYENNIFFQKDTIPKITSSDALSDLPSLLGINREKRKKYRSEPMNRYQELMRKGSNILTEHYILPDSPLLTVCRPISERRIPEDKPAPNIDTRPRHRDQIHYQEDRLISIREFARLQSFPDSYVFWGNEDQKLTQIGNAIPPILAQNIADRLIKYLNDI